MSKLDTQKIIILLKYLKSNHTTNITPKHQTEYSMRPLEANINLDSISKVVK